MPTSQMARVIQNLRKSAILRGGEGLITGWEAAVNRGRAMSLEAATRFAQGT